MFNCLICEKPLRDNMELVKHMSGLKTCFQPPITKRENTSDIVKELRYIRNILERLDTFLETNKRIISENTSDNEPQKAPDLNPL
jgi:hypothetical protein